MTLDYPPTTPTLSITVRNPILGNSVTTPLTTNMHVTMSGKVVATKRTLGYQRLLLAIENICDPSDLINFIRTAKGQDCKLTLNTDSWVGKIVNNPIEITQELRKGHDVTLEFQGEKQ